MTKSLFYGVLAAGLLAPGIILGQQQQVQVNAGTGIEVKDVAVETQKTPNFQAGDVKSKNVKSPRDWLEVEIQFEAKEVNPRKAVIPELQFKYYVAIKGEAGTKVLSGEATHINVEDGEEYYSAAYVSPSTLGKITGDFKRFQSSDVVGVGVEIFYKGVLVGGSSTAGGKFWEALAPEPGVLAKAKSPFALLWLDRYADVQDSN